jgi:hypothetical protein
MLPANPYNFNEIDKSGFKALRYGIRVRNWHLA